MLCKFDPATNFMNNPNKQYIHETTRELLQDKGYNNLIGRKQYKRSDKEYNTTTLSDRPETTVEVPTTTDTIPTNAIPCLTCKVCRKGQGKCARQQTVKALQHNKHNKQYKYKNQLAGLAIIKQAMRRTLLQQMGIEDIHGQTGLVMNNGKVYSTSDSNPLDQQARYVEIGIY